MTSRILSATAGTALAVLLGFPAAAAEPHGWYLGFGSGWSQLQSSNFLLGPPAGPASGKLTFGDAAAVDLAFGYKFGLPIRTEFELRYADYDARQLLPNGLGATNLTGDTAVTQFFGNVFYDLPLTRHIALTLGTGIGGAMFDPSFTDASANRVSGGDTVFTWQAIGGLTFALSDHFELQADYRYQSIDDSSHAFNAVSPFGLRDKDVQSVMINLRWYPMADAAPPPAPPPPPPPPPPLPPPPPAPVKTFIIFFDFDKSDLTEQAQQVVADAVTAAKAQGAVHVVVTGHTDTVGSETYNMALSLKRAGAVKAQMVADGLGETEIATVGKGFAEPLVQTGPGVREPQNRRAVIDLGG
ncbi:MAG: OmpA family protein [Rhizomicrobium sp.]